MLQDLTTVSLLWRKFLKYQETTCHRYSNKLKAIEHETKDLKNSVDSGRIEDFIDTWGRLVSTVQVDNVFWSYLDWLAF